MKKLTVLCLLLLSGLFAKAQNTNISGTINDYTAVTSISGSTLTVGSSGAFSIGDLALVIQMQGANIDETNSPDFGDIVGINSAGNYEIVTVCNILDGTTIAVSTLQRTYDPTGVVQLVRVPVYQQATVTSMLSGAAWDGSTGGIVALSCEKLVMNADINMNGTGFNGGGLTTSSFSCQWWFQPSDYFYDISTGEGAMKGEGLSTYITNKTGGRGPQANGGGGGNDHNAGGGGGANAGAGGQGGERIPEGTFFCSGVSPGEGGKAYTYNNTENKIFLGGGGGAGHENNAGLGSAGANGGGIVIILADTIEANSNAILANGLDGTNGNDGVGGGGAGGSVLIDAAVYTGTLNVEANGADGGSIDNIGPSNCNGPGGGGGGGVLWTNGGTTPPAINFVGAGGSNGTTLTASQTNCVVGSPNSATAGSAGTTVTGLAIPMPLEATSVDVQMACDSLVWIDGLTYYASNNTATHVIVGGAASGCDSTVSLDLTLTTIDESVTQTGGTLTANSTVGTFQWIDCGDLSELNGETNQSYTPAVSGDYAVVVTENGCVDTSACFSISGIGIAEQNFAPSVYPNPANGAVYIDFGAIKKEFSVSVFDLTGRWIDTVNGFNTSKIEVDLGETKGVYILNIESDGQLARIRIVNE